MKTEILISTDDWENRVAVLEGGALAEIYFEREEKVIGSIYKGRVENVLPGMGACFVNIGLGRNAFLYVDDIRRDPINIGEEEMTERRRGHTVGELLKVGDEVLVQIVKEPRGLKGARVSTNISLPGRYLVLMPTGRFSGVSSRIEDDKERERLKHIMRRLRPEGMATIVRTAAAGVSEAELLADLGVQVRLWHTILESYRRASAPALLHKDLNLIFKAVRDFLTSDVEQVIIDSKEQYEEIRSTMALFGPQYLNRLKLWQGPGNLFEVRGIDEELQKLLKPKIFLPSGGHLVIESTEALTVIDVNTGKFTGGRNLEDTIVRTNVEAAAEIARQVRLRDIGGIIVVDFIDMAHERSREQVIATLSEALRRDRTRSTIQMFSNLGLLEFTRKRVGKDLAGQLRSECPYCGGLGDVMSSETLAIGLLRQIRQNGIDQPNEKNWDIVSDPSVATQLMGWYREEFEKLAKSLNANLHLFVQPQRHREQVILEPAHRQRRPLTAGKEVEADLLPVRLPDPAAGVAVVDNTLVEVKDAANGVGQSVKLRITSADGNFAHAELAEPLQAAKRRRRRRGKAAIEAEERAKPLPPPAQPAAAARIAMPRNVFGLDEDEEEDYTLRGRPAGSRRGVSASTARRAPARGREEGKVGRDARPVRGGRGQPGRRDRTPAAAQGFQPLVVGGESDIDYDDGDESSVVVVPDKTKQVASIPPAAREGIDTEGAAGTARRRRRRRGRGGRKPAERDAVVAGEEPDEDLAVDNVVGETDDAQAVDLGEARERRPRRFTGPIRQLYGAPVELDETSQVRAPKERSVSRRSAPPAREPGRAGARPPARRAEYPEDDLDAVVEPTRPASLDVKFVAPGQLRPRQVGPRATRDGLPRERDVERELPERAPRERGERERRGPERGGRERGGRERGGRERGGRGRGEARPARVGPAVKQVYPPSDVEPEPPEEGERVKRAPMGKRRPSHGALFGAPEAAPPPKGKVRQLYPPPPEGEAPFEIERIEVSNGVEFDREYDRNGATFETIVEPAEPTRDDSLFVTSDAELEERRRRARERAERRQLEDGSDKPFEDAGSKPPFTFDLDDDIE